MDIGQINLDLDRTRIRDVLLEAYKGCSDLLEVTFNDSPEAFVSKINPYLDCNRITIPVQVSLPSRKYPELVLDVDLRRKKVFGRMASRSKQAMINYFLKTL
jgi:hypothetical protein